MPLLRSSAMPAAALSAAALTLLTGAAAATAAPQPHSQPVQQHVAAAQPHFASAQPHLAPARVGRAALPATAADQSFTGAGRTSTYHVYADGIDPSRAVGVVYYLGGDYRSASETWVRNPGGTHLRDMADAARSKNMILVVPISPDRDASGDGITWWEDADGNGEWFRALQTSLTSRYGLDTSRVWLAGYSGGAEFITYELLADRQDWIRGGGATIIGGGGSSGMQTPPGATVRSLPLRWHVGSVDTAGDTTPAVWSARAAATHGRARYVRDGFTSTSLDVLPGLHHTEYDIVGLLRADLASLPAAPTTPPPASWLRGAIRTDYLATGGVGVYGQPTSVEKPGTVAGGVYQGFTNGWTYYWSPQTGAHPVQWGHGIGNAYRAVGYERGWGYPATAERPLRGGAYQDFRLGNARFRALYSTRTGTHAVKLTGAIGTAWQRAGFEHGWGYPVTDEYPVAGGVAQKFSTGRVATWHRAGGGVTVTGG